jgi:hypothetical protein
MARPVLIVIAALLAAAPGAVLAQAAAPADGQVVSTAPAHPAPAHPTAAGDVASVEDARGFDDVGDDGPVRDNRIHGEISVGAGTNGYREVGGVVTAPIGDVGQATIAVDSEQYDYRRR